MTFPSDWKLFTCVLLFKLYMYVSIFIFLRGLILMNFGTFLPGTVIHAYDSV